MKMKPFIIGTLVGGLVFFLLSSIYYAFLMADFYAANAGSATGVMKDPANLPLLLLGEIAFGALYTYIFLQWANISTFSGGLRGGVVIGFLLGLGFNLIGFATANTLNLTAALVDAVWSGAAGALTGGIIGWVLGRTGG